MNLRIGSKNLIFLFVFASLMAFTSGTAWSNAPVSTEPAVAPVEQSVSAKEEITSAVASTTNPEQSQTVEPINVVVERYDFTKYPCMSIGASSKGRLVNGRPLPQHKGWTTRSSERQYATPELIEGLSRTIEAFRKKHPNSSRLITGDISYKKGGPMLPHRSHQSGRDIDVSLFVKNNRQMHHFEAMNSQNLDVPKTWDFIEALMENAHIEYILVDYSIQKLLYEYVAIKLGAAEGYLLHTFQYPRGPRERTGIIRHSPGHRNHLHIRFFTPKSVAAAKKYAHLDPVFAKLNNPDGLPASNDVAYLSRTKGTVKHRPVVAMIGPDELKTSAIDTYYTVMDGDSVWSIARKYGITVSDLYALNGLDSMPLLNAGMQLKVLSSSSEALEDDPDDKRLVPNAHLLAKYGKNNKWHTVRDGESLWTISNKYNVQIADLCSWNDISFKSTLSTGQKLMVAERPAVYAIAGTLAISRHQIIRATSQDQTTFTSQLRCLWRGISWATLKNFFRFIL